MFKKINQNQVAGLIECGLLVLPVMIIILMEKLKLL